MSNPRPGFAKKFILCLVITFLLAILESKSSFCQTPNSKNTDLKLITQVQAETLLELMAKYDGPVFVRRFYPVTQQWIDRTFQVNTAQAALVEQVISSLGVPIINFQIYNFTGIIGSQIYAERFSLSEIKMLIELYKTPGGRRVVLDLLTDPSLLNKEISFQDINNAGINSLFHLDRFTTIETQTLYAFYQSTIGKGIIIKLFFKPNLMEQSIEFTSSYDDYVVKQLKEKVIPILLQRGLVVPQDIKYIQKKP